MEKMREERLETTVIRYVRRKEKRREEIRYEDRRDEMWKGRIEIEEMFGEKKSFAG